MDTRKLIAGALGLSLLVAAVPGVVLAQEEEVPAAELSPEGVDWTLMTLAGEPLAEGVEVTLFLGDGEVVGDAGCNSYFGNYEIDGDTLTFPDPFGITRKLCEDAVMAIEDAYLPLLQATANWAIDEEGALSLADADGAVQLVYSEATIGVTASDVDALTAVLEDLQTQIDEANVEVAAIVAAAESVNVNNLRKRITAVEESVADLEKKVGGINSGNLKKRIAANEKAIAQLQPRVDTLEKTIDRFRERIKTLEASEKDHEERISALEATPEQPLP